MTKKILLLFLFSLLLIYPVGGVTLTIIPENPVAGEEITMRGTAAPNEVLQPTISFGKTVGVSNGKYDYKLYGIKIPSGENNFAVTANNVKNLNVRVKILLWWTKSADATNGIAAVSQGNVPSGTYDIRIDGDAADSASSVPLTITASSKITADAQGNFEYKYSSSGVPPGTFTLNIGGITRTITLSAAPTTTATPAPASGGGGGGDGGGGGAGASGENPANIEIKEKYDLYIFRDKVTSYSFTSKSNPVLFVNITGNVNAGEINTAVEVLRNTSSLVKSPASGVVYKNINIWVGTSGFAVPKNLKEAIINFRVENSWLGNNNLASSDVKMLKWDGSNWAQLGTVNKTMDSTYTYYEAKTDSFSIFAISGMEDTAMPTATTVIVPINKASTPVITPTQNTPVATTTSKPAEIPGFEITIAIIALIILRYKMECNFGRRGN